MHSRYFERLFSSMIRQYYVVIYLTSMVLFFNSLRGAKKSWRKDASTCSSLGSASTDKTLVSFSGGSFKNTTQTLNPIKQNCMVSFRGGGDFTGITNIVSSVNITPCLIGSDTKITSTGRDTGWRQNSSDSKSMVVQTSSSARVTNLLDILCCNTTLILESGNSAEFIRTEENIKHENVESRTSVSISDIPVGSNLHNGVLAGDSRLFPVTESDEEVLVPVLPSPDPSRDSSSSGDPLDSLDKINFSSDSSGGDEILNGEDIDGSQIRHIHCPYHLSDDGAFVFSTN